MSITNLSRRSILKASGVAIALPWLEASGIAVAAQPKRMVNICATLGLYSESWFPQTAGKDYVASEYLQLIDKYRDQYTLFSGLHHSNQSGRQPHNSEVTFLTSAEHPGLDGFKNTRSLDQAAADHFGYVTRFPSMTLSTNSPQSQSYTEGGVMIPAQTSPSRLFQQLFLKGDPEEIERERRRLSDGGSILDFVGQQTMQLKTRVSNPDREKLDAYYESIRQAERDLIEIQAWQDRPKPSVDASQPTDVDNPSLLIERLSLMLQIIPLILDTDSSRVVSVMIQDHGAAIQLPGVNADQHNLSHHGQDESKIAQLKMIETAIVNKFGDLLRDLSLRQNGGVSLLDSTTVLFGSNLGNANSHLPKNLPILVAGGPFAHGKHHIYEAEEAPPLSNLFLTLLQGMGVPAESFGHSTGSLQWS